jgi:hypothetical protein
MCTLSWRLDESGYVLAVNRDERRTRLPAEAPRLQSSASGDFLAPVDGDAGGTWVAVNEHGLALVLLNAPLAVLERPAETYTSRGQLVRMLAGASDAVVVAGALAPRSLGAFRGFKLALFAPGAAPRAWTWDGAAIAPSAPAMPLCSSPLPDLAIAAERERAFARRAPSGLADLLAVHASHGGEKGPCSVCMHAPEAGTVSLTAVEVDPGAVRMRYAGGPPCETPLGPAVELARRGR